jgi:hypothetical protein
VNRTFITFLLVALMVQSAPAIVNADLTGGVEFSHDSDDADMYGVYTGYSYPFENSRSNSKIGFRVGLLTLTDPIGTERFKTLELSHRSEPVERAHLDLKGRWLNGDWSPLLYAGNFSYKPSDKWYIEVFGERGIVDSVTSVRLEYLIDTYGFSIDYAVTNEFTLVVALFDQNVSDGNERIGKVGRIVYTPRAHDWLNLQIKTRIIDNDFGGIGYFSPDTLSEYFFLIGLARPFADDDWVIRGLIGPGLQRIDEHGGGSEEKPAFLMEAKLKGWFTQEFGLDGRVGYTTAQKTGGSDRYIYGHVNLTHTW